MGRYLAVPVGRAAEGEAVVAREAAAREAEGVVWAAAVGVGGARGAGSAEAAAEAARGAASTAMVVPAAGSSHLRRMGSKSVSKKVSE